MRTLFTFMFLCLVHNVSAQCNPVIDTSGNSILCDGSYVNLHSSPGDTYQWYLNGVAINNATNIYYHASVPGSYTVEVDSQGCVAMSQPVTFTLHDVPPQPGPISGPTVVCAGQLCTYSVAAVPGALSYSWSGGDFYSSILPTIIGHVGEALYPPNTPNTTVAVSAVNECGGSIPSVLAIESYSAMQLDGFDSDPDISDIEGVLCPGIQGQVITTQLHPTIHGSAGYMDSFTFQWYLDNVALPGETNHYLTIYRGGDYKVEIITQHCGTFTIPKWVHQGLPYTATITPNGPLDFCSNNVQPLSVSFDMTGVDQDFKWWWINSSQTFQFPQNVYSVIPDTSGYYGILGRFYMNGFAVCEVYYPSNISVTVPPLLEVTQIDDTLFATPGYDTYQWYESGNILAGETQQKHTLTFDGFYTVEGVFMNGCVENSSPFDSDFMPPPPPPPAPGNNPQEPGEEMTISPNPFTNNFILQAKVAKGDDKATISITDASGRVLFEKEVDAIDGIVNEKIDLGDASAIVGTIRLRSAGTLKTQRFFKK